MPVVNKKYKDRVFCLLFGKDKANALSLYNAVNGTNYTNAEDLIINTIDDVIYMGMKNDVSFVFDDYINIYEHQSTYNPNMPLRCLLYLSKLYEKECYIGNSIYSSKPIEIATPKFVVFYNGDEHHEPIERLDLTDLMTHPTDSDINLTVRMININYSEGAKILDACNVLKQYSRLVQLVKDNLLFGLPLDDAINEAVNHCINHNILSSFLKKHKSEVIDVMLEEWDQEAELKKIENMMKDDWKAEGVAEGMAKGKAEGMIRGKAEERISIIKHMLSSFSKEDIVKAGFTTEEIEAASKL